MNQLNAGVYGKHASSMAHWQSVTLSLPSPADSYNVLDFVTTCYSHTIFMFRELWFPCDRKGMRGMERFLDKENLRRVGCLAEQGDVREIISTKDT